MSKSQFSLNSKKLQQNPLEFHKRSRSRQFSHNTIQQLIDKAKQLYNNGQLKKALSSFEQIIQQFSRQSAKIEVYVDACYYSAMICMTTNEYEKSLKYLENVIDSFGNFKGNSLLLLSIVYQKMGKSQLSLKVLNELCQKQKSVDGLFYRAKLRFVNMQYEEADKDLSILVNQMQVKNIQIRLLYLQIRLHINKSIEQILSDAMLMMKQIENIQQKQWIRKCRNIMSQAYLKKGYFKEVQQYLELNLKQKRDSETLFIKSNLHALKKQTDLQILLLNQCINVKDHKISVKSALENLVILSMKQKDFYEAFEYSKRNVYLKIEGKVTLSLLKMVEAMTLLMKKNFCEGLSLLNQINSDDFSVLQESPFIKQLYFGSIGFANFSIGKHEEALKIYEQILLHPQNQDYKILAYNIKLCEGILNFKNGNEEDAIKSFQASSNYLSRPEPYFYIAVILIQHTLQSNIQSATNHYELIGKVIQIIDSGLRIGDNYQMYYYRSLLYFYLGMSAEALDDVDKAIDKAEENVAKFFYLRALIFMQQKNYESSLAQISTCLSIDQNYFDAYLKRAQIKLLTEDGQSYEQDLQRHPLHKQWQPLFLLHQKKYEKIIDENLGNVDIQQVCNLFTLKLNESGVVGKIIMGIKQENYNEIIQILTQIESKDIKIGYFQNQDIYLLKAYCYYQTDSNQLAIDYVQKCETKLKKLSEGDLFSEDDEKKLLAVKVNAIYLMIKSNEIGAAIMMCQNLANEVYEGLICDELNQMKLHLQSVQQNHSITTIQKSITIFNTTPMISDIFPSHNLLGLQCKFLIPFPKIKIPDFQNVGIDKILVEFGIQSIENKGESPWMKKDSNGVIFTNKIQVFDNLKLYSESDQNQQDENMKDKIKESLVLDAEVVAKLERIKNREVR